MTILILTVKSCQKLMVFFRIVVQITVTHAFPKIPQLPDLEYLYRVNSIWSKINTLSNTILNAIHDIIDSDSSTTVINFIFFFLEQQPLPVKACLYPLVKWAWLSVTFCYRSRIVSPAYGGTVYSGLEPMTDMLLSRSSWRLYHQTGPITLYSQIFDIQLFQLKLCFGTFLRSQIQSYLGDTCITKDAIIHGKFQKFSSAKYEVNRNWQFFSKNMIY